MPIGRPGFHHEKKLHPGEQNVSHNWAVQEFHGSFRVSKAGKFHHMGHLLQQQQQLLLINSSVDSKKYLVLVVVVVVVVSSSSSSSKRSKRSKCSKCSSSLDASLECTCSYDGCCLWWQFLPPLCIEVCQHWLLPSVLVHTNALAWLCARKTPSVVMNSMVCWTWVCARKTGPSHDEQHGLLVLTFLRHLLLYVIVSYLGKGISTQ